MKVVQINVSCDKGSIGKICVSVSRLLTEKGIENYILYAMGNSNYEKGIKYSNEIEEKFSALFSKVFGNYGFNSFLPTFNLIRQLKKINPDIVHLHNIHNHNVNISILFRYLKRKKIKVFWTFHDCWAFTGYCTHYMVEKCEKWQSQCCDCEQYKKYSWFFDCSKKNHKRKKKAIENADLTVITPSKWLAEETKKSIFSGKEIITINNGIDLNIFKPRKSDLRQKYNLSGKFVILGVAYKWHKRKGIDVFLKLAERLDKHFQIILVGTDEQVDLMLPKNIISIHRTHNQTELAELYSMADLLLNPSREDNYPTVNIEAVACGTKVLYFDVGGSRETVPEGYGFCVNDDIDEIQLTIEKIAQNRFDFNKPQCEIKTFADEKIRFNDYLKLYENI